MRIPELAASRVTEKINSGEYSVKLSHQQYLKHVEGTAQYNQYMQSRAKDGLGPQSYFTITEAEVQQLLTEKAGTGIVDVSRSGEMLPRERFTADRIIGMTMSGNTWIETNKGMIIYGKNSSHITPIGGMNYD